VNNILALLEKLNYHTKINCAQPSCSPLNLRVKLTLLIYKKETTMTTLYTTSATALAGRNGQVSTDDNKLNVALSYPKEMGGTGEATNPEQLFAAGYAACFSNALLHVARETKVAIKSAPTTSTVGIGSNETGGFALTVTLSIELELEQQAAVELVTTAHQVCPYSNAVRGNIDVKLIVNGVAL
jgi:osmotically inducible protein OsmC